MNDIEKRRIEYQSGIRDLELKLRQLQDECTHKSTNAKYTEDSIQWNCVDCQANWTTDHNHVPINQTR